MKPRPATLLPVDAAGRPLSPRRRSMAITQGGGRFRVTGVAIDHWPMVTPWVEAFVVRSGTGWRLVLSAGKGRETVSRHRTLRLARLAASRYLSPRGGLADQETFTLVALGDRDYFGRLRAYVEGVFHSQGSVTVDVIFYSTLRRWVVVKRLPRGKSQVWEAEHFHPMAERRTLTFECDGGRLTMSVPRFL